jgi:hypothetical protein
MRVMQRDNGGPAFPVLELDQRSGNVFAQHMGMSLRDWFAGQVVAGLMSYPGDEVSGNWHNNSSSQGVANRAYELADAMLAASTSQVQP